MNTLSAFLAAMILCAGLPAAAQTPATSTGEGGGAAVSKVEEARAIVAKITELTAKIEKGRRVLRNYWRDVDSEADRKRLSTAVHRQSARWIERETLTVSLLTLISTDETLTEPQRAAAAAVAQEGVPIRDEREVRRGRANRAVLNYVIANDPSRSDADRQKARQIFENLHKKNRKGRNEFLAKSTTWKEHIEQLGDALGEPYDEMLAGVHGLPEDEPDAPGEPAQPADPVGGEAPRR